MAAKKRPPLTPARKDWAEQRGGATFKGKPLNYPAPVMQRYENDMLKLIRQMTREYRKELTVLFSDYSSDRAMDADIASQARIRLNKLYDRFDKLFRREAPLITKRMFNQVDKYSAATLKTSLKELSGGVTLVTTIMPASLATAVTAGIAQNVELISNLPEQYYLQIQGDVMRSLQPGGEGRKTVFDALKKYDGITERRAKTIATDQVRKATTTMNTERNKALGVKKFTWLHSSGSAEPREDHVNMNGKVFSYDDPPIIDSRTGERGFPGQLINCRCVALPVIEFGGEDE